MTNSTLKTISIIGRPNVGKSTFFNRLLQKREAIISNIPGVTRDRNYGQSEWNGVKFYVVDTGGYTNKSYDIFHQKINKQIELAINESSAILFLVDGKEEITDVDHEISLLLRRMTNQPIFLVINKVDNPKIEQNSINFYELGYSKMYCISSISGSGTGDLLDDIVTLLLKTSNQIDNLIDNFPKVAIVGRPNVGKSTLINTLLGEERSIVSEIPGTTRDSIQTIYKKFGYEFTLIDTAGIRKKNQVFDNLEFYSTIRTIRSIDFSHVVLLIINAENGLESQDMSIFRIIQNKRKGIIIVVNKWDLIQKDTNSMKNFEQTIRKRIAPFSDIPIIFTSIINKQRIFKVIDTIISVYKNRSKRIKTSKLNQVISEISKKNPHPIIKSGKYIKIKYCTQLPVYSPQFVFFCNFPNHIKENYKRYLENQFRKKFDFTGVPIQFYFRKK